ncbi:unnamed protein product [Rotaria magnacalcarata]
MVLLLHRRTLTINIIFLCFITLSVISVTLKNVFREYLPLASPYYIFFTKSSKLCLNQTCGSGSFKFSVNKLLLYLNFSIDRIYHHNGIAYDYYSRNDIEQTKVGDKWKLWPLPNEIYQIQNNSAMNDIETSPFVPSKLLFVDKIYVMTDPRLTERHANLQKALSRQGISVKSIEWRIKWNLTTCNSISSHSYVYKGLNLKNKPLNKQQQRKCALAMKHADVWYEIAERKIPLGLILEDDAIFVPFFKEKFARMIYTAIHSGALRINGTCAKSNERPISDNEWIDQNPMIVIGTCFNFHGQCFQKHFSNAPPLLSTHKSNASRCTHAYLLTSCSAQALVSQIQAQKNDFWPSDFMQNMLFPLSSTLQSFWMDPPLVYQGNQVFDLGNLSSFREQTYMSNR